MILGSVSQYAAAHATCPVVIVREQTTAARPQVGVGIGDPASASAALAFAFEEASLRKASLIALHAWDSGGDVSRAARAIRRAGADAQEEHVTGQLQALVDDWTARYPDVEASYDLVYAHPGRALVGLSARADLIVLGRHRPDGLLPGPGAVRHAVLNHAHGPVVTVP
jgi:nucleotide-binding universal stress UspA family protein